MKKLLCFLTIINMLFLSACGIYSDYRDLDGLIIVETMGADYNSSGYELSFASAAANDKPVRTSSSGSSVNDAMDKARSVSVAGELFFSHIGSIIIGDDSAKEGIYPLTEFICRSPRIRTDADIFLVGGKAKDAIIDTGDDSAGIVEQLSRIHESDESGHGAHIYSAAEIINRTEKYGASLVNSLEVISADEDTKAVVPAGYGILKDYGLAGKLRSDLMYAVALLENRPYISSLNLPSATVQLESGSTDFELIYTDGEPDEIAVTANVSATVLENSAQTSTDTLKAELEQRIRREIQSVLRTSKETEADFLALSYKVGEKTLIKSLPYLKFTVTVSAEIKHSNDISE